MGPFIRRSSSVLGLDIGSTAVGLVELSRSASGYRVDGYALAPLPPGAVTASNISDANAIGEAIRRAIERAGCKAKKAALAVPGSAAITKVIAMDASLTDDELEAAITVEADRHLPFQADQVAFDFEPLHLSASDPSQVDVLLAACRRQHVERLEEVAAHGGLQAAVVDVESFCVARAAQLLRAEGEEAPLALAAIGATTTSLLVVARDAAIFTREEPFAAERLGANANGGSGAGGGTGKEELLRLLSRLLRLFLSRHPETPPQRLLLAGSGASSAGLAESAAERLHLATEVANPFAGMALAKRVDAKALERDAPMLMTACGLAMRSFDAARGLL